MTKGLNLNGDVGTIRTCDRLLRRQIVTTNHPTSAPNVLYLRSQSQLPEFPSVSRDFPAFPKICGANVGQKKITGASLEVPERTCRVHSVVPHPNTITAHQYKARLINFSTLNSPRGVNMAMRLTDTTKWNDDWFLELPPRMKCAWEYIRDNCSGGGFLKVSFRKLSDDVGEPVTREDFDRHIGSRVHWYSDDSLWVCGLVEAQNKPLVSRNDARINTLQLVVTTLKEQTEQMSPKAKRHFQNIEEALSKSKILREEARLARGSDEARPSLNREKGIDKREKGNKGGVGENSRDSERHERAAGYIDKFVVYINSSKSPSECGLTESEAAELRALIGVHRDDVRANKINPQLLRKQWTEVLARHLKAGETASAKAGA